MQIAFGRIVLAFGLSLAWFSPYVSLPDTTAAVAQTSPGRELRVMTFNIQHGLSGAGQYDLKWATQTIAKVNPDIVGVQELTRNHPFYKCEDQAAQIAAALGTATGRRWTYVYRQQWTTKVLDCHGDGPETEGVGFFSAVPTEAESSKAAWNGGLGLLTNVAMNRRLPIIVTHLAAGNAYQADRVRQLETLVPWTADAGVPRIFVGDFNFKPESDEYRRLRAVYRDGWADAVAAGTARGRADGITHKSSRIDYIFYVPGDALQLEWVETVDTRALVGKETSDHRPVVAAFRVK